MNSLPPETLRIDFLDSLVLYRIAIPDDDLDSNKTVYYQSDNGEYTMQVPLVDGKLDGEALFQRNGILCVKMEFTDGNPNGVVEKYNQSGEVVLRGYLMNGSEDGLFKEYRKSTVTWVGCYKYGRRYSVLRKSAYLKGYYEERLVEGGGLLSIAQYDDGLQEKIGYSIECEDGRMDGWVYQDGDRILVLPDYDTGTGILSNQIESVRKRDAPEECGDDSSKRVRFNDMMSKSIKNSLVAYEPQTGFLCGVYKCIDRCYELIQSEYENRMIVADLKSHEMRVYKDDELEAAVEKEAQVALDMGGRRWVGRVKNGKPYGYGIVISKEGKREYEGFMMGEMKICLGTEYYDDAERVKYSGCFYDNERFGNGILYNLNGSIKYEGLWKNNEPCSIESDGTTIDNHTEAIIIPNDSLNETVSLFLPSWLCSLKRMVIGNNSCKVVHSLLFSGIEEIESIVIGDNCFANYYDEAVESEQSTLEINNCPKLKSIQIGDNSFLKYGTLELKQLPSLESIRVGKGSCEMVGMCSFESNIVQFI